MPKIYTRAPGGTQAKGKRFLSTETGCFDMLASALDGFRLSIHVLAAAIWVGGQLTLAGLVPALRGAGEGVANVAARAFAKISWPAYVVLVLTGLWNVATFQSGQTSTAWKVVLGVKLAVVALSGLAAWLHTKAKTPAQNAVWGAISGTSAAAAMILGVFLAG
ncbi:MAG: hypothetical protein M0Z47_09935 [Actinomycetota bacterium]|nr:hypothetical protein [Actinomycetota bacterium]